MATPDRKLTFLSTKTAMKVIASNPRQSGNSRDFWTLKAKKFTKMTLLLSVTAKSDSSNFITGALSCVTAKKMFLSLFMIFAIGNLKLWVIVLKIPSCLLPQKKSSATFKESMTLNGSPTKGVTKCFPVKSSQARS